jgi:tetratricopeptide (TPR) repeat protein
MTPDVAARSAEAAEAALPGLPGPLVLLARAEVRRGAFADAWAHFERARALSPKSLEAPAALHDFATCALESGHPVAALAAYRALVPRAALLGDRWEELSIFVEAAALATRESKDSLAEAIGYLTEARRRGTLPGMGDALLSALALSLDRAGRSAEAASVARDASGPSWLEGERAAQVSGKRSFLPALPPNEIDAMIAIVAERSDRALSLERWQSYLASEGGKASPYAAHARAHRDALVRGVVATAATIGKGVP